MYESGNLRDRPDDSQKPVALIKLGYLSNEEEESKLIDQDYQKEIVQGLADGLDAYYGY